MRPEDFFDRVFKNKNKVLIVMAHPDDAEIYAGGTIARLIETRKDVRIIKVTSGNRGSRQEKISAEKLTKIRFQEDGAAMKSFGILEKNNVYLELNDGEVDNSFETISKITYQIRKFKPDIVMTHNPEDMIIKFDENNHWVNHRDHRNTGKSTIDAAYPYSRDLLFFPEQLKEQGVESHTVHIKISEEQANTRSQAIAAHTSQYTFDHAKSSTDFFTKNPAWKERYERFRYVICD
ncbi:PIG-L family deacetylase [Candidatus Gottesmanbacteria bacterium]|nr:PIG-L family deacetylase [Candidatus Gottesmanbacteria bacterium]